MNLFDKQIENLNLYERNTYRFIVQYGRENRDISNKWEAFFYTKCNKLFWHKNYLNYVEVPITTRCSLKCKECANLIQYYSNPTHCEWKNVVRDINRLCQIVEGIGMLRILGGEPLLHPYLPDILETIVNNKKIKQIQIVTNGTLLCSDKLLSVLIQNRKNKKISFDISCYKKNSIKYEALIRQLKANGIKFYTNKNLIWTEQSNCKYRHRNKEEMKKVFSRCKVDCISMLNGQLHLCPRSSHGMDLKLIPRIKDEYIDLRSTKSVKAEKKNFYNLLNINMISACNYCDIFRWKDLKKCLAGEQITKDDARVMFDAFSRYNGEEIR